jgi:hypothetical protein
VAFLVLCTAPAARASRSFRWANADVSETQLDDQHFWDADQQYWASQFGQLQKEMFQLQKAAGESVTVDLQMGSQPISNKTTASNKTVAAAKPAQVKLHNATVPAKNTSGTMDRAAEAFETAAAGLSGLPSMPDAKAMQGKAMLAPMLAMLKGMYDDQKQRIGKLNKHEEEAKKRFAKQKAEYEARIFKIKNNTLLSPGTAKNATEQATKFFKYWERSRERSHRQFHNALKITHSSMQKEKEMIAAYEKAISGKAPSQKDKTELKDIKQSLPEQAPEVVLAQQRKVVAAFCQETLKEIDGMLRQQKELDPELK